MKFSNITVSARTADVVDVVYVNIVTLSTGCIGVGELAKGKQLIANQGQEWMGIRTTSKIAGSPSSKKAGNINKGWQVKRVGKKEQGEGLTHAVSLV